MPRIGKKKAHLRRLSDLKAKKHDSSIDSSQPELADAVVGEPASPAELPSGSDKPALQQSRASQPDMGKISFPSLILTSSPVKHFYWIVML